MVVTRKLISEFLAQHKLALVGISRGWKKFGNAILKDLTAKGYQVFPVHPQAATIDGHPCWPSLRQLPERVGGAVIVLPPSETEKVILDAAQAGIARVWMQQGSESDVALRRCEENGISAVHGECILMYTEPAAFFHRAHRWMRGMFGKLPR